MAKAKIERPARGATALLVIDMINAMDFDGGEQLVGPAETAARAILALRKAADKARVPTVYVNDNFGQWHSERERLVDHVLHGNAPGQGVAKRLKPRRNDFFVIKPQFSGFYSTNLPVLLPTLGASRLILTGVATDICVLFTAADAHMREYDLWVPADTVASVDARRSRWALEIMQNSMQAEIRPTTEFSLADWLEQG